MTSRDGIGEVVMSRDRVGELVTFRGGIGELVTQRYLAGTEALKSGSFNYEAIPSLRLGR